MKFFSTWRFEVIGRDQMGAVLIHTGHSTEASRDMEIEVLKTRAKRGEPISSIEVVDTKECTRKRVYP